MTVSPQIQRGLDDMVTTLTDYVLENLKKQVRTVARQKFGENVEAQMRWMKWIVDHPGKLKAVEVRAVREVYEELVKEA